MAGFRESCVDTGARHSTREDLKQLVNNWLLPVLSCRAAAAPNADPTMAWKRTENPFVEGEKVVVTT